MHEYSIVRALIDRVEREARARGATSVQRIHVRIGELAGVEKSLLATAYETVRERTLCSGAGLEINAVEARWVCSGCGKTIARGEILECRECGRPARLEGGDEIMLERIDMEVA